MTILRGVNEPRAIVRGAIVRGGGAAPPAPTYATWNPADLPSLLPYPVFSNGDLTASMTFNQGWDKNSVRGNIGKTAGTGQYQFVVSAGTNTIIGIAKPTATMDGFVGSTADGWGFYSANGNKMNNGGGTAYGSAWAVGDVITIYYNFDDGTLGFMINGADQGTIATGWGGLEVKPMGTLYDANSSGTANFGATTLTYPKAGYDLGWYTV